MLEKINDILEKLDDITYNTGTADFDLKEWLKNYFNSVSDNGFLVWEDIPSLKMRWGKSHDINVSLMAKGDLRYWCIKDNAGVITLIMVGRFYHWDSDRYYSPFNSIEEAKEAAARLEWLYVQQKIEEEAEKEKTLLRKLMKKYPEISVDKKM
jgi:hypothetical protein